jgi:hypothetical protein
MNKFESSRALARRDERVLIILLLREANPTKILVFTILAISVGLDCPG